MIIISILFLFISYQCFSHDNYINHKKTNEIKTFCHGIPQGHQLHAVSVTSQSPLSTALSQPLLHPCHIIPSMPEYFIGLVKAEKILLWEWKQCFTFHHLRNRHKRKANSDSSKHNSSPKWFHIQYFIHEGKVFISERIINWCCPIFKIICQALVCTIIYQCGLTLIPIWISNCMPSKVWDEILIPKLQWLHHWSLGMDK